MRLYLKLENKRSSKRQIDIKSIENDILKINKNEYRAILSVSSINFELKSEDEQDSTLDIYKSFLNSLPCSIQIIVRIRSLDLNNYISKFRVKSQPTKAQIKSRLDDYCQFVSELVSSNKILSRNFYIVVPHNEVEDENIIKEQLNLKCDLIQKGLLKLGIQSKRLKSLEITELIYSYFNPEKAKTQPITERTINLLTNGNY